MSAMLRANRQNQSFDSFTDLYDRWQTAQGWEPWLSGRCYGGKRALDAGCGAGHTAEWLASRFETVTALDLSAPLIALGRERHNRENIDYQCDNLLSFADPAARIRCRRLWASFPT